MFKTILFWLLAGVGAVGTVGIALLVPSTVVEQHDAEESYERFRKATEAVLPEAEADESDPVH
jgi:hypothetical protein